MSMVKKPILLDETGKEIAGALRQQNALLSAMARGSVNALASSWKDIHNIVREGLAAEIFHVGDQLIVPWKDVAADKTYEVPLDIVHFGNVTLKNGSVVPAMFLQWHYCVPINVQFDHQENERASETSFLSEYYYYEAYTGSDGSTKYKLLIEGTDYAIGSIIPSSKVYYHSAIKDPTGNIVEFGYNRWSHSAIRQFLNSVKGVNEWWKQQHLGDVAPDMSITKAGFMSGFEEDFLSCLKPIKVTTMLNTVTDSEIGTFEETYDTFFLPSVEQVYAKPILAGVEGEPFEYWKQALGRTAPAETGVENKYEGYFVYALENREERCYVRLRSPFIPTSHISWNQNQSGYVGSNGGSNNGVRIAPVCVIC